MGKTTNTAAKSFAEEGLEDIQQYSEEAETNIDTALGAAPEEEGEMQVVSGVEPIAAYYQLKTPTKPGKSVVKIYEKGVTLKGTYARTLEREVSHKGRKFTSYTFLVRLDDGKIYGLTGGGLGGYRKDGTPRGFMALENGSKVHVTYTGQTEGKDGEMYDNFIVLGNKVKKSI